MALLRRWKAPTSGKAGRTWEDSIPIHLLLGRPGGRRLLGGKAVTQYKE